MSSISFQPAPTLVELRARIAAHLLEGELDLPILPDVAASVLHASRESGCDARKLATLVESDPAMAGHVLRVANSSAYAPREPIVSLQQAISRLGFTTVREIAIAVALHGKVFAARGHEDTVKELWLHAALAASWGKEIARMRRRNVEAAFLCGLLHDIGRPVVLQFVADVERKTRQILGEEMTLGLMDEYHTFVGERLVSRWSLPTWVVSAILWHHRPEEAPADVEIARCACLADLLAHWTVDPSEARLSEIRDHHVLASLSLYDEELDLLLAQRDEIERVARELA